MHVDDSSGLSPKTVASAADLVRLGELALDKAIISEIVAQESINLPDGKSHTLTKQSIEDVISQRESGLNAFNIF